MSSNSTIRSTRRARLTRRAAIAAIATVGLGAGLAAGTGTAFAASGPIVGTVTVAGGTTVSLSSASFSLTAPTGATTTTVSGITATVSSNDANGYTVSEQLDAPGFTNGAVTGLFQITPRVGGALTSAFSNTGVAGQVNVATKASASGPSGDPYALDWDFQVPANAVAGAYTGSISVLAAAN